MHKNSHRGKNIYIYIYIYMHLPCLRTWAAEGEERRRLVGKGVQDHIT